MSNRDRFDKFTERARRVLQYAQEEAQRFQHNYIGTEHLLLGLLHSQDGVAIEVLQRAGVELTAARRSVEFIIGRGDRIVQGQQIGLTPRAKKVIELAVDEARRMNHHYIGTEHLLLGLVREGEGIAAGVLESLGVRLTRLRQLTLDVLGGQPSTPEDTSRQVIGFDISYPSHQIIGLDVPGTPDVPPLSDEQLDSLTGEGRTILQLAEEEAHRFQHNYIGTEHLLLGLTRLDHSLAKQILDHLGVELQTVRTAIEFIIGKGDYTVEGERRLAPRAKKVIALAIAEAQSSGQTVVGSEHFLLGLVREGEGIAAGILASLGVHLERLRRETIRALQRDASAGGLSSTTDQKDGESSQEQASFPNDPRQPRGNMRFDKFTTNSRRALANAQEEAQRLQHNYIGTEHLLLGLLRLPDTMAAQVLQQYGIVLEATREAVTFIVGRGDRIVLGEIGLTPRAKKVIELAVDEASNLASPAISPEHLLLGLLSEGSGIAVGVIESLKANPAAIRQEILRRLQAQKKS